MGLPRRITSRATAGRSAFTPGSPLPSDRHVRGGSTSCGRWVSFVIARDGRLVRRTCAR
jgi:hypothetical protein